MLTITTWLRLNRLTTTAKKYNRTDDNYSKQKNKICTTPSSIVGIVSTYDRYGVMTYFFSSSQLDWRWKYFTIKKIRYNDHTLIQNIAIHSKTLLSVQEKIWYHFEGNDHTNGVQNTTEHLTRTQFRKLRISKDEKLSRMATWQTRGILINCLDNKFIPQRPLLKRRQLSNTNRASVFALTERGLPIRTNWSCSLDPV